MAFNGLGTFVRLYNWVTDTANGIFVRNDRMDAEMDGMATGLSNCITKDGQQILTADIPWGGFKITGLGTGVAPTDGVNFAQVFISPVFSGTPLAPTAAAGTNTTQIATTAYVVATAFAAALPAQPGGAPTYQLTSRASTAGWSVSVPNEQQYLTANGL